MSFKDDYIADSEVKLTGIFDPDSTLHLGIDFQGGYCLFPYDPGLISKDMKAYYERQQFLLADVTALAQSFRAAGVKNVWVQQAGSFHAHEFADVSFYKRGVSRERVEEFAAQAHEICVSVNHDRDRVMLKNAFNLFATDTPAHELREQGAKTLILTGGAKDVCLLATAKGAVENGFATFIIDDLTYLANAYEPEQEISDAVLRECVDKGIGVVRADHVCSLVMSL